MSDALTEIARDNNINSILATIDAFERMYAEEKTTDIANRLIKLWVQYKNARRGYWHTPDQKLASNRIKQYEEDLMSMQQT
jgi:hypothetical protein